MNPLRVAIVGCGRISDLHQVGYQGREDARIVAVCDTRKSRAKQKAKACGVEKKFSSSPWQPCNPLQPGRRCGLQKCLSSIFIPMILEARNFYNNWSLLNLWVVKQLR
jgi:hypothetical protein